ncbi:MAG: hypothetical protein ACLQA5_00360 [Solirubrobacteraceae bacterium]
MSVPRNMLKELLERKLWPIALVLVIALVAVPVLLTKKAPTDIVTPPTGPLPYSSGTTLPAISVQTSPGNSNLVGKGRNPFTPQHVATTSTITTTIPTVTTPTTGTSTGTTSVGSGSSSTGSGSSGTTVAPATTPTVSTTPTKPALTTPPKPAPATLTATESYHVSLAVTAANGNLNTIDPLERLSILPSEQQPMLIDLGVLQGGKSVMFVVEPGTVVSGAGTCTPGPIDCEILTLNPGQTAGISKETSSGSTPVALLAVNSITVDHHPSVAAANKARETASDVGRQLLNQSPLNAISLFQYDPSVGAVVDLRNLTVGGS